MKKNDGGPAFPIPLNRGEGFCGMGPADGMTLRAWFAGQVAGDIFSMIIGTGSEYTEASVARDSIAIADALIEELNK